MSYAGSRSLTRGQPLRVNVETSGQLFKTPAGLSHHLKDAHGGQHAVSGCLNDTTLIFGDRRINQLDAMSTKSRKRTSFIQLH